MKISAWLFHSFDYSCACVHVPLSCVCQREDVRCNRVWQSPADWQPGREDVGVEVAL